jgi:hypothetical protein
VVAYAQQLVLRKATSSVVTRVSVTPIHVPVALLLGRFSIGEILTMVSTSSGAEQIAIGRKIAKDCFFI